MNYKQHHDKIIDRARDRILECYTERHHIVPRCMGGSDDEENIVRLTASEHYVVHQLLVKIYPNNYKLAFAAKAMTMTANGNRPKNKLYKWVKEAHAIAVSKQFTGTAKSDSHRRKLSAANKGNQPWNTGVVRGPTSTKVKRKISAALSGISYEDRHGAAKANKLRQRLSVLQTGKQHSESVKRKMSESAKNRQKIKCIHCDKIASPNMIKRWHNNNCRNIPITV